MSYVINTMMDRYKCTEDNSVGMMCMGAQAPPGPVPSAYAIPIAASHIPMDMGHDIGKSRLKPELVKYNLLRLEK